MRQVRNIIILLALALSGCTSATYDWVGRNIAGLDCRAEKLDAAGRCVPTR